MRWGVWSQNPGTGIIPTGCVTLGKSFNLCASDAPSKWYAPHAVVMRTEGEVTLSQQPRAPSVTERLSPSCPGVCLLEALVTTCWLKKVLEAEHPAGITSPKLPSVQPGTATVPMSTVRDERDPVGAPAPACSAPALRAALAGGDGDTTKGFDSRSGRNHCKSVFPNCVIVSALGGCPHVRGHSAGHFVP